LGLCPEPRRGFTPNPILSGLCPKTDLIGALPQTPPGFHPKTDLVGALPQTPTKGAVAPLETP